MTSRHGFMILLVGATLTAVACSPQTEIDWEEPPSYVFSMNAYCDQPVHGRFIVTVQAGEVTEAVPIEGSAETFLRRNGIDALPTLGEILASTGDGADITFDDAGVPSQVRTSLDGGSDACFDILAFSIPLPDDDVRSIYAQTIARVCAEAEPHGGCSDRVEVSERFDAGFGAALLPMPELVRETIEAELPDAVFTDADGAPDGTVRLLIGPYEIVRDGVVRVEAGYTCGGLCGSGRIWYYEFTTGVWQPTSAGAVGELDSQWEA